MAYKPSEFVGKVKRIETRKGRGGWEDGMEGAYLLFRCLDRAWSRRVLGRTDLLMAAGRSRMLRTRLFLGKSEDRNTEGKRRLAASSCRTRTTAGRDARIVASASTLIANSPPCHRCLSSQWLRSTPHGRGCEKMGSAGLHGGGGGEMPRQVLSPAAHLTMVINSCPRAVVPWPGILSSSSWACETCDCPMPSVRSCLPPGVAALRRCRAGEKMQVR
jgi:hypothetical protein